MKTVIIFSILYACYVPLASCQYHQKLKLNNRSFTFQILRTSTRFVDTDKLEVSQSLIKVNMPEKMKREMLKLKRGDWINLLLNDSTDWIANLCLYEIYKKDATSFEIVKNKEDWRKCCKDGDVVFWRRELKD